MTRAYEVAIVVNPDMTDAEIERYLHTLRQLFSKHKGEITEEDSWGRRPTAYKLAGKTEGFYIFFKVQLPSESIMALDQDLKLDQNVIRHLITLDEGTKAE